MLNLISFLLTCSTVMAMREINTTLTALTIYEPSRTNESHFPDSIIKPKKSQNEATVEVTKDELFEVINACVTSDTFRSTINMEQPRKVAIIHEKPSQKTNIAILTICLILLHYYTPTNKTKIINGKSAKKRRKRSQSIKRKKNNNIAHSSKSDM